VETVVDKKLYNQTIANDVKTGDTQNVSRYLVTTDGEKLIKVMKPIKRKCKSLKMVYFGWRSRKFNNCNKNMEISTQHEYDNAYNLGYRTEDGGDFTYTGDRRSEIEAGKLVTLCNNLDELGTRYNVDIEHYVKQAEKLVNALD